MSLLVLAIDSDSSVMDLMEELLSSEGYEMRRGSVQYITVTDVQSHRPDVVILEMQPCDPDSTIVFLGQLRNCVSTSPIPVIVDSTDGRLLEQLAEPLHQLGCITLEKPFNLDRFSASIDQAGHLRGFDWHLAPPAWLVD